MNECEPLNGGDDPSLLASTFQFVAPVIGPLPKDEFISAFTGFKLQDGLPDAKANFYNFHVVGSGRICRHYCWHDRHLRGNF